VPVPFATAVLTLPLAFRSRRVRVELAPVLLRAERPADDTAGGLRIFVRWRRRWRRGTGYVEMTDAGPDGVQLTLHLAARSGRRLGKPTRDSRWSLLTELRAIVERAALVDSTSCIQRNAGPVRSTGDDPNRTLSGR
jgi:hypothetical protein